MSDAAGRLRIDHDHVTGKYRGFLCDRCNMGLGCFRDNVMTLQLAIDYLNKHGAASVT